MQNSSKYLPLVLVVEDEVVVRDCAVAHLENAGFSVIEADNAEDAMLRLEERPEVSTVFTDIQMAGRYNGLLLAHKIRVLRPNVQVIVTSGLTPEASALPPGVHFLPKPYDCDALTALISAH